MGGFSNSERDDFLARSGAESFDLCVVGGGITGAGIARDAAMRGLRVALVEKGDFASGTSGGSSRLIHGGLRYLKERAFGLVREAVEEREILARIAPHLALDLSFLVPAYEGQRPRRHSLSLGVLLYEALGGFRSPRRARTLSARAVLAIEPRLASRGLQGGVLYHDRVTDDARLTLETVMSAAEAGARVANHVEATALVRESNRVTGVEVRDRLSGGAARVSARSTILALGAWLDPFHDRQMPGPRPALRPTRGSHLVLARDRLPLRHAIGFPSIADGRPLFLIPWGRFTYAGTTDLDHESSADDVAANSTEIDYLLETVNRFLPEMRLGPIDVTSTWSALRPLVRDDARSTSATSREHRLFEVAPGLFAIAGGKLTTYRRMAAEAVDRILDAMDPRPTTIPARTDRAPLPGAVARGGDPAAAAVDPEAVAHLAATYGGRASEVLRWAARCARGAERIHPELPHLWAEVDYAVAEEMALTLEDFILRRTAIFHQTADHARSIARPIATRMAGLLSWDQERLERELARHRELCARHERFRERPLAM